MIEIQTQNCNISKLILEYYNFNVTDKDYAFLVGYRDIKLFKNKKKEYQNYLFEKIERKIALGESYKNIVFNEITDFNGCLIPPLDIAFLKDIINSIKRKVTFEKILINEKQIINSYLRKKNTYLELCKTLGLVDFGIQFHCKFKKGFLCLPIINFYLDFFKNNGINTHLTEISIWEPNESKQAYLFSKLYEICNFHKTKCFRYHYLLDRDSNTSPYKKAEDLPGLLTLDWQKLRKDYPNDVVDICSLDSHLPDVFLNNKSQTNIDWSSYITEKEIFKKCRELLYAKRRVN